METLVLPAQDQLAYHQDSQDRMLARMMYSAKRLPHSSRTSCGSPSRIGLAFTETKTNLNALNSLPGDRQSNGDIFPAGLLPRPGDFSTSGNMVLGFPNPIFFGSAGCNPHRCVTTPCLPALRVPLADGLLPVSQATNWKMVNASSRSFSAPKRFACRRDGVSPTQRTCRVGDNSIQSVNGGQCRGTSPRFTNAVSDGGGCKLFLQDYAQACSSEEYLSGRKTVRKVLERRSDTDFANKTTGKNIVENRLVNGTKITMRLPLSPALGRTNIDRNANNLEKKKEVASKGASVVTILQRPKAKDVATEKLARFSGGAVGTAQEDTSSSPMMCLDSESVYLDCAVTGKDQFWASDSSHLDGAANPSLDDWPRQLEFSTIMHGSVKRTVKSLNKAGHASLLSSCDRTDALSKPTCRRIQMNDSEYIQQTGIPRMLSDEDMFGLGNYGQVATKLALSTQCQSSTGGCIVCDIGGACRDDSGFCPPTPMNERWAGPAFSNSPPPSCLPFPKFSLCQLRDEPFELTSVEEGPSKAAVFSHRSMWTPVSPSEKSQLIPSQSCTSEEQLGFGLDIAYATKDLRRILNLDFKS